MLNKIRGISAVKWMTISLAFLSIASLLASVYMTFSIDVITDWKLTMPDKKIHAGDTIVVESDYIKTRDVTGKATRDIDCQNKEGSYIRYHMNEAIANRAARSGGTGLEVKIPTNIPNLPTTCKIAVTIDYPVLPWRTVTEANETDEFTLYPERKDVARDERGASSGTSQTPSPVVAQSQGSSSFNNTPNSTNTLRDSSQNNNNQNPNPSNPTDPDEPQQVCEIVRDPVLGIEILRVCREEA